MSRLYNNAVKQLRARVIEDYLKGIGKPECVCFSCGNASARLEETSLLVHAVIKPDRWWTAEQIQAKYDCFDATSGHLPGFLMARIADILRQEALMPIQGQEIPTGSGETFVLLKMAFPTVIIKPVYNLDDATRWHVQSPLNSLVAALF